MTEAAKPEDDAREDARRRQTRQQHENPSGHGMQVTPGQQREVADSPEHKDDRASAVIDKSLLDELKD